MTRKTPAIEIPIEMKIPARGDDQGVETLSPSSWRIETSSRIGPRTTRSTPDTKITVSRAMRIMNGSRTTARLKRPRPRVAMIALQIFPALRACSAFFTRYVAQISRATSSGEPRARQSSSSLRPSDFPILKCSA